MSKKKRGWRKKERAEKNAWGLFLWMFTIVMFMMGISYISLGHPIVGALSVITGLMANPPFNRALKKIGKRPKNRYYIPAVLAVMFLTFLGAGKITSNIDETYSDILLSSSENDETKTADTTASDTEGLETNSGTGEENPTTGTKQALEGTGEGTETDTDTSSAPAESSAVTAETITTQIADESYFECYFLDMGQSDCTIIICDGQTLVFDTGDNSCGTKIQAQLNKLEHFDGTIDTMIVSHFDADHAGAADVLINKYDINKVIYPDQTKDTATCRDVLDAMKYKGYSVTTPVVGDTYTLGSATYTIIGPTKSSYDDINDSSVGIILTYGDTKFLFTGDAEEQGESDILATGIDISCDVYQAGHHGSKTSSSSALLDAASPTYAVISCGEGNSYGHPHAATLNFLRDRGIQVYRTDEQGTIVCTSDGTTVTFDGSPSTSWQAGEATANSQTETTKAQTAAQTAGETPDGTTYILNTNSMKFHSDDCSGAAKISENNKQYSTLTRAELIEQGYSPCGICNP